MARFLKRFEEVVGWYPKDMPREERILVRKIDFLVLTFACLSFFTKYLDVTALTNAYVSGMETDLHLTGNRLNYINAVYQTGYCLFQIPSNIILTRVPAQHLLPAAEIIWGLFTLGTAFVKTYNQLLAMRFFVGLGATSCYVGLTHIINSWYRKHELGRRNALFWISSPLAQMFAGYLQSAAYTGLNGVGGLQGWRWLFIICTIITLPIAFLGFAIFPDVPERTTSRWLTEDEKKLACTRLEEEGFQPSTGLSWSLLRRTLLQWRFHAFIGILVLSNNMMYAPGTPFLLWLDSQPNRYSIPLVNNIGTVTNAAAVVCALVTSWYADLRGSRWEVTAMAGFLCVMGNIILAVWNVPSGLTFFAFIAIGWSQGNIPVITAWAAEELAGDLEARAITFAVYNTISQVTALVVPLVAWPVSKGPSFFGGYIWSVVISVLYLANTAFIPWRLKREVREKESSSQSRSDGLDAENGLEMESRDTKKEALVRVTNSKNTIVN